jgi:hypothetical protein
LPRVAIRGGSHYSFGRDIAARAGTVLDDDRLPKAILQPLTDDARQNVGRAAGGKADENPDRPRRIGLRRRDGRENR